MASPPRIRTPRELGLVLRERRRALGLSQQELADKVGASRPWIVEIERGKPRAELGLVLRTMNTLGLHLHLATKEGAADRQLTLPATDVDIDAIVDDARKHE